MGEDPDLIWGKEPSDDAHFDPMRDERGRGRAALPCDSASFDRKTLLRL